MNLGDLLVPIVFVVVGGLLAWYRAKYARLIESITPRKLRFPTRATELAALLCGIAFVLAGLIVIVLRVAP